MNIADLVARHANDERRPSSAIVLRPSADALSLTLPGGPVILSWDEPVPDELGTRTIVDVIAPGQEEEQVAELSAALGDTDVALLLFRSPPEMMPVGVVTDALSRHGLTVLDACGTGHRSGRTALAVSRDAARHQRAYLTGTPIPDDESSQLRQRNESIIEGLQLRAGVQLLERRLEGQAAELLQAREERRRLDQELTEAGDLSARLSVLERELSASHEALTTALAARGRSRAVVRREMAVRTSRIRRAARLLAENPRQGWVRIGRVISRRWRR